jgi:hypothetical protein
MIMAVVAGQEHVGLGYPNVERRRRVQRLVAGSETRILDSARLLDVAREIDRLAGRRIEHARGRRVASSTGSDSLAVDGDAPERRLDVVALLS